MPVFEPERLDFVFSNMHEGVLVEDENRTVKFTNAAFTAIFAPGVLPEQMYGADCDAAAVMSAPLFEHSDAWLAHTRALVAAKRSVIHDEWQMADGRWLDRDYFPRVLGGEVIEHMWVYRDVTEKHRRAAEVASGDSEAGEFRGWEDVTARLTRNYQPILATRDVSVVLIKLLVLERINTELGHDAGDEVLAGVMADLRDAFGAGNVERVRGATFAVILEGVATEVAFADIRSRLDLSRRVGEQVILLRYVLGASSGSAATAGELDSVVASAFVALSEAARTFTDVVSDDDLLDRMRVRFDIEARLQPALAAGEFELFYQPIKRLDSREVVGAEALLRWRHPHRGLLPASAFIPHIESLGLMPFVDLWVIDQVCAELATLVGQGVPQVGVNLSPLTLNSGHDILGALMAAVETHGIERGRLVIEVTESAIGADPEKTMAVMRRIHDLGFPIAIDDFGVGTSTLGLLKDVSFDYLKLDKSFTTDLDEERVQALITAVCAMTTVLGGTVIAEGVENESIAELLLSCGVTTGQGWFLGFPEPMHRFGSEA
ncbi:MAG: Phytochrome-like protein cph2 [Actinomycetota bacterium]|jgi:EAL domain-containing protein (putative c-di-GMP-specific phosphodiesterase class I)/GGDEF domain-containing protein